MLCTLPNTVVSSDPAVQPATGSLLGTLPEICTFYCSKKNMFSILKENIKSVSMVRLSGRFLIFFSFKNGLTYAVKGLQTPDFSSAPFPKALQAVRTSLRSQIHCILDFFCCNSFPLSSSSVGLSVSSMLQFAVSAIWTKLCRPQKKLNMFSSGARPSELIAL